MANSRPAAESFTVMLGHPVLVFLWSAWMLLLGCTIGMHCHRSHTVTACVCIACAVLIVAHEIVDGWIWCTMTAWWIGKCQGKRAQSDH